MNIQVSNLDQKITKEELINLFQQHGEVNAAEVVMDAFTGQPRGFAIVEMQSDAEAQNALVQLDNIELNNRAISLSIAKSEERKGSYLIGNAIQRNYGFQKNMGFQKRKGSKKRY